MSAPIVAEELLVRLYIFDHDDVSREVQTILGRHMTIGVSDLTVTLTHSLLCFSLELAFRITTYHIVDELAKPMVGHGVRMSLQILLTLKFNLIALLHLIERWLIGDLQLAVQYDEAHRKPLEKFSGSHTSIGAARHLD